MPSQKRKTGDQGERIAVQYLKNNGYKILDRNYQKKWGEIDIITKRDKDIIFIEVKTRNKSKNQIYFPEDNVHFYKQKRLIRTAQTYLWQKNYPVQTNWQIDIIAIELNQQTKKAGLRHLKNIIWQ